MCNSILNLNIKEFPLPAGWRIMKQHSPSVKPLNHSRKSLDKISSSPEEVGNSILTNCELSGPCSKQTPPAPLN